MTTAIATLPPVVCTSWCTDGTGHPDSVDSDEQFCRSSTRIVPVACGGPGERPRGILVNLYRDAHEGVSGETRLEPPHVEVAGLDLETLRLSIHEARALAEALAELADLAERWR